jgi:hypothetical protein
MTHGRDTRFAFLVWSILAVQILACYGPVSPSRGMVVSLRTSGPSIIDLNNVIAIELGARGFVDAGQDGRDAINNRTTAVYFHGPEKISVFEEIDLPNEVPIRVRQAAKTFTPSANRIFEDLAVAIETRWPGSVVREPGPTK